MNRSPSRFDSLMLSILFGVGLICIHRITEFDYWTHLALGREFLAQHSLFLSEPFLASLRGQPLSAVEWPFQVLLHFVHTAASHAGVSVFVALTAMATCYVLARRLPEGNDGRRALGLLLLSTAFFAARARFGPRPEILVFLLIASTLSLALSWRDKPRVGTLATLLGLFLGWWQLHVTWSLGAMFVLLVMVSAPHPGFWKEAFRKAGTALVAALFLAGALAATADVVRFGLHVLSGMGAEGRMVFITEMRPLWEHPAEMALFSSFCLVALLFAWGGRAGRLHRLLFWTGATALGLLAARNYALGIFLIVPIALDGLAGGPPFSLVLPPRLRAILPLGATVLFVGAAVASVETPWGAGLDESIVSVDAATFVRDARLPAPLFNTFEIGGCLDYVLAGDPPTYIDGRSLGGDAFIRQFRAIVEGDDPVAGLAEIGSKTVVARSLFRDSGRIYPLVFTLLTDPRWRLVRATDALVFVRADALRALSPLPAERGWDFVFRDAEGLAKTDPDAPHLPYTMGVAKFMARETAAANDLFAAALRRRPELAPQYAAVMQIAKRMSPP